MLKKGEFSEGWPVLSAAAVGVGLGLSPLPFYTIGVFIPPLLMEFGAQGWTAGFIFNALAIYTLGAFAASPVIGLLAERFGARRVTLVSIVTFSLAMMAIALNTGSKPLYLFLWLVLAFAGAGTLPITFTRPVANWFRNNRGKALGIALIATGIFGALSKYFAQYIVDFTAADGSLPDWRLAYIALGCLPLVIALPIAWLGLRDVSDMSAKDAPAVKWKLPILAISLAGTAVLVGVVMAEVIPLVEKNGLRLEYAVAFAFSALVFLPPVLMMVLPIDKEPPASMEGQTLMDLPGMSLGAALKDWRFWLLAISFVPISYAVGAIIPNIENVLRTNGISQSEAVGLATLTGLAVLAGRVIGGVLIDKFWAPGVAFVFLASPAIALYLLGQPNVGPNTATLAILMIGFGAGVEYDFMAYIVSKYFGMKRYSAIYGAIYGFFALGAGLGPGIMVNLAQGRGFMLFGWQSGAFTGWTWDETLTKAAILLVLFTVPLLFLGRYRYGKPKLAEAETAAEKTAETGHA